MEEIKVEQAFTAHTKRINANGDMLAAEIPYLVFNAETEEQALNAVKDHLAASTIGKDMNMVLSYLEIDGRDGMATFRVNAVFEESAFDLSSDDEESVATVSFDCGGGTKHVTHSIKQDCVYGNIDAGGAIGWNGKGGSEMQIAGVDVPTAQLRETYTKKMKLSKITNSFKRKVASLVGKVNSGSFKGWGAGEVMFLGMSYSCPDKRSQDVDVTFNFAIQTRETDVKIGDATISKKGFEYAWALSETVVDNGVPKVKTKAVFVEQVCDEVSFADLKL